MSRRRATPPRPSARSGPASKPRRRVSNDVRLSIGFVVVVLAAIGLLATAAIGGPLADARHGVVTVDGTAIDRSQLRARMDIDAALQGAQEAAIRSRVNAAELTDPDGARLLAALSSPGDDPLHEAIDGLVADQVVRDATRSEGLSASVDVARELALATTADFAVRIGWVTLADPLPGATATTGASSPGWPGPAPAASDPAASRAAQQAALTRAHDALAGGTTSAQVTTELSAAGWRASAGVRWLSEAGAVDGVPDGLVTTARDGSIAAGSVLDPTIDQVSGTGSTAIVMARGDRTNPAATAIASQAGIDGGALRDWAQAQADRRALREAHEQTWRTTPQPQVRVAELAIGSADLQGVAGAWMSFAHVIVDQLPASDRQPGETPAAATAIAAELRALSRPDREARFAALVTTANAQPSTDPLRRSGELGYFTKDQLVPELGGVAFADGVAVGDVLGPVTTIAGAELFIVRARFDGTVDERANAALVESRTSADLLALARRISPAGEAGRADGTLWRAEAEVIAPDDVHRAYVETEIGRLSEPFVEGGEIVLVRPLERRTAPLDAPALARLRVRGFDAWLADRIAHATVVRDPEPLSGVKVDAASPSPTTSRSPIETPNLPVIPLASAPTVSRAPFPIPSPPAVP